MDSMRMDKRVVRVTSLTEDDEKGYWLSKTVEERLEALELMRQIAYGYSSENPPRFQRVLEVVERRIR